MITAAVAVALPRVARWLEPAAEEAPEGVPAAAGAELPLELVGVSRPFSEADRVMLDEALGLPAGSR